MKLNIERALTTRKANSLLKTPVGAIAWRAHNMPERGASRNRGRTSTKTSRSAGATLTAASSVKRGLFSQSRLPHDTVASATSILCLR